GGNSPLRHRHTEISNPKLGTRSVPLSLCGYPFCSFRLSRRDVDNPGDAKSLGHHAKARRERRIAHRHSQLTATTQRSAHTTGGRAAGGDAEGGVEILRIDEEISTELLARRGEGTVGYEPFAFAHAHAGGRRDGLQGVGGNELAGGVEVVGEVGRLDVALLAL